MTEYDWADDSKKCYDLAIKSQREIRIRDGRIQPRTPQEYEQAFQGPVESSQLDCVKYPCIESPDVPIVFSWDQINDTGT